DRNVTGVQTCALPISHILCTPHHNNGKYSNEKSQVISLVASLQAELEKRQLPLTLLEGQEVRITGTLIEDIHRDEILFTDLDDKIGRASCREKGQNT